MRILIVNYRYFISGGPERYLFNMKSLFEAKGHKIIPFSFNYSQNVKTPYSKYFADPPGGKDAVFYKDLKLTPIKKIKIFKKVLYNSEVKQKIKKIILEKRVDIAYMLQIVNFMYPSVIDACHALSIPIVYRLSDFQLLCPSYHLFRDDKLCEKCLKGNYYHGIVHRCLKNSFTISGTRVLSMYLERAKDSPKKVSAFITPSKILRRKMIKGGFPPEKLHHLPNFIYQIPTDINFHPGNYILYVGAIDKNKGVRVLIEAFAEMKSRNGTKLILAGSSTDGEYKRIINDINNKKLSNIEFKGFVSGHELSQLYRHARFIVMPSTGHENMPNAVLEAMSYGKPVIGSDLDGVAEMINHGKDGLLFKTADAQSLRNRLEQLTENDALVSKMGQAAHQKIHEKYSSNFHYNSLMQVFNDIND